MTEQAGSESIATSMAGHTIDRRTLLRATAILSAVAANPAMVSEVKASTVGIRFVVTDNRFSQSVEFGRQLTQLGAERLDVTDGLTSLWQQRLVPHWREPEGIVAGLTTRAVWDGLSQQALGQFRRPRLLGDHRFRNGTGEPHHKLELPAGLPGATGTALLEGTAWPAAMALLVRHCTDLREAGGQTCEVGKPNAGRCDANQLVSWTVV